MKYFFFPLLLVTACFFHETEPLQAQQTLSDVEISALIERVEIKKIDGREMAFLPLREILTIALNRSLTMKASQLGEELARSAVIGARERNHPSVQTSYEISKTPSLTYSTSSSAGSRIRSRNSVAIRNQPDIACKGTCRCVSVTGNDFS